MDKIVYLYGSARDASTRSIRRNVFPRGEMQVRIGMWTVRPSRRVAVNFARLAPYRADLITKVTNGVVQVQRADTTEISLTEILAGFDALGDAAPNLDTMALAELQALNRAPYPGPEVRAALARRVQGPTPAAQPAPAIPPPPPVPVFAPTAAPVEEVPEAVGAEVGEVEPVDAAPEFMRELPEDWRLLTNRELIALCDANKAALPEKITKASLIQTLESWLKGE